MVNIIRYNNKLNYLQLPDKSHIMPKGYSDVVGGVS